MHALRIALGFLCSVLTFTLMAADISVVDISCICGYGAKGSIEVAITNTEQAFTFEWNGPNYYRSTVQNPNDLIFPGEYFLTYTNEVGCAEEFGPVVVPLCPAYEPIHFDYEPVLCEDGTVDVITTVEGGTAPYAYAWSNGTVTSDLLDVPAGAYALTITDTNDCTTEEEITIIDGQESDDNFQITMLKDCLCTVTEEVQVFRLETNSEHQPLTYEWTGPSGFSSTEQSPKIRTHGSYSVTVTNQHDCTWEEVVEVPSCFGEFTVDIIAQRPCDGMLGTLTAIPTGDHPPFKYLWSTGAVNQTIEDVPPGVYEVIVTDSKQCQALARIVLEEAQLQAVVNEPLYDCGGEGTATIAPEYAGGMPPYTYLWSTGSTDARIYGATAGSYTLTLTDSQGCSEVFAYDVKYQAPPSVRYIVTPATCSADNGSIKLQVSVPHGQAYFVDWGDNGIGTSRTNLTAGQYSVTVTELGNPCPWEADITVPSTPSLPTFWEGTAANFESASNPTACDGAITLTLGGSHPPFNVLIHHNGNVVQSADELAKGEYVFSNLCGSDLPYQVLVVDAFGCEWEEEGIIGSCELTIKTESITNPKYTMPVPPEIDGGSGILGSIDISISGEVGEVDYFWSTGDTTEDIDGLTAGDYSVTVTDKEGCESVMSFTLEGCYEPTIEYIKNPEGVDDIPRIVDSAPTFDDFEIVINGGIVLPGAETTPMVALYRVEGGAYTANIPPAYKIEWIVGNQVRSRSNPYMLPTNLVLSSSLVTLKVSNGCVEREAYKQIYVCGDEVLDGYFVVGETLPCPGGSDGEIAISIPFLTGPNISLFYNNQGELEPISLQGSEGFNFIGIRGGLSSGQHNFLIEIEDCKIEFSHTLGTKELELEYVSYDQPSNTCTYTATCNDLPFGNHITNAGIADFLNASSSPCGVPVYCEETEVHFRPYGKRTCRGLEYNAIVNRQAVFPSPFTGAYLAALPRAADCDWVTYCTATLKITSTFGLGGSSTPNGVSNNGCLKYKCSGIAPNIRICPWEECSQMPDYTEGDPPPSCEGYQSFNVHGLLTAYEEGWLNNADGFIGSTLQLFLDELSQTGNAEERDRAKCANAIFCTDTYELFYEDLSAISCEVIQIPVVGSDFDWGFLNDLGGVSISIDYDLESVNTCYVIESQVDEVTGITTSERIRCQSQSCQGEDLFGDNVDDCTNEVVVNYSDLFEIFGINPQFTPPSEEGEVARRTSYFNDPASVEKLVSLSTLTHQNSTIPKAIISSSGGNAYYDYTPNAAIERKTYAPGLIFQEENWDHDMSAFVVQESESAYTIYVGGNTVTSKIQLSSTFSFDFESVSINAENNTYTFTVKSDSDVYVNDQQESALTGVPGTAFLTFSQDGALVDVHTVSSPLSSTTFVNKVVQEQTATTVSQIPTDSYMTVDNTPISTPNGFMAEERVYAINTYQALLQDFNIGPFIGLHDGTELDKFLTNKNGDFVALFTKADGISIVGMDGVRVNGNPSKNLLVGFSALTNNFWQKEISMANVGTYDMLQLPSGAIALALSFENSFTLAGQTFSSLGGEDVLLMQLDQNGYLLDVQQFGGAGDETVEALFYNGSELYFAGQIRDHEGEIILGEQTFMDHTPYNNEVYISYIKLEEQLNKSLIQNSTESKFIGSDLAVKPNPFSDQFIVEFEAAQDDVATLELIDILGRVILRQEKQVIAGYNSWQLDLGEPTSNRVLHLFVSFASGSTQALQTKIIQN